MTKRTHSNVSTKIKRTLRHWLTPDSFVWWVMLAVSMLSLPLYIVVTSYGVEYHQQVAEILILALSCTISVSIGVNIFDIIESGFVRHEDAHELANGKSPDTEESRAQAALSEYDRYIHKISALNENHYTTQDGTVINTAYSRSSNYIRSEV